MSYGVIGLAHIGIPTNCYDKSKEFYSELGFAVEEECVLGDNHVVFMRCGDCVVELYEADEIEAKAGAVNHIALKTNDIEASFAQCKNENKTFLTDGIVDIALYPNGSRYFIIEGPNKEAVEFNMINM